MDLTRLGVFVFLDGLAAAETTDLARTVERLGYSVLWIVEGGGRDALTHAGFLLAGTERLIVASGVASIWGREPTQMASAARTAAEASGGRFILGLGSNNPLSMQLRGLPYDRPVATMREYVRRVRGATYMAPAPPAEAPVIIAANNPKMLEVARSEAQGTITYIQPVEHTRAARAALGSEPWLCVSQAVLLEPDSLTFGIEGRGVVVEPVGVEPFVTAAAFHRIGGSARRRSSRDAPGRDRTVRPRLAAARCRGLETRQNSSACSEHEASAHVCGVRLLRYREVGARGCGRLLGDGGCLRRCPPQGRGTLAV